MDTAGLEYSEISLTEAGTIIRQREKPKQSEFAFAIAEDGNGAKVTRNDTGSLTYRCTSGDYLWFGETHVFVGATDAYLLYNNVEFGSVSV